MDGLAHSVAARMPLASGVLHVWRWVFDPDFLAELYRRHRGRGYERALSFAALVHLIADALLTHDGSAREAFERASERGALPASIQAAYGKLRRFPPQLSEAFLAHATQRLQSLWPLEATGTTLPASVAGYDVLVLDGKTVKGIARRLKPLRGVAGGVVGGKALVALDLRRGLAIAMQTQLDGNANEVLLTPALAHGIRAGHARRRLWIADRAFSYLQQVVELRNVSDDFLVRRRADITFEADPDSPVHRGCDAQGRPWRQELGWLSRHNQPRALRVRQIVLALQDHEELILLTSLLDPQAIPAADLLDLYRQRWSIERVFQEVTEVFGLRRLIGSSPQASLFQFALCLLLYNTLQLVRAYIAVGQHRATPELSSEKIFRDLQRQLSAWMLLIGPNATIAVYAANPSLDSTRQQILLAFTRDWTNRWLRSPTQKRHPPPKISRHGKHVSAQAVLERNKQRRRRKKR